MNVSIVASPGALNPAAVMAGSPYAHLAHMTSAYGLLGPHPFMTPPFGGLGSLSGDGLGGNPLGSPGALSQSSLSPSTGTCKLSCFLAPIFCLKEANKMNACTCNKNQTLGN